MSLSNLNEFITLLKKNNELMVVDTPVDANLEITEITDRVCKHDGPALLFTNVKNSEYPVLINALGSIKRMELALEAPLDHVSKRLSKLIDMRPPEGPWGKVKMLPMLAELGAIFPKKVKSAPCQHTIIRGDDIDITKLPILKCWPDDGGRFITLPCVFTEDPVTGVSNCGMYRMQEFSKNTTGMHWHKHHGGAQHFQKAKEMGLDKLYVSVAIGAEPVVTYSATAPLPDGINEMLLAGFLRNKPVEVVKSITNDIYVPAESQIVLEGYVEIGSETTEGPFGDHTGYYSLADQYPVFTITCVTMRKNPIYQTIVVGKPPMEDSFMGLATTTIFLPLIKTQLSEVVNLYAPMEGTFHNMLFVSIDKKYPMQAKKVMTSIWGLGQLMFTKMIVIVDENVDVTNTSEVLWRMSNNVDWKRDTVILEGPLDALDHSSPMPLWGGKIGIDATIKWESEGHTRAWPDPISMDEKTATNVDKIWAKMMDDGLGAFIKSENRPI